GRQQLRARLARQHGLREPARQPVHRRQDRGRDAQRHGGGRQQRRRLDVFRQRPRRGLLLCRRQAGAPACGRQGRAHRRRQSRALGIDKGGLSGGGMYGVKVAGMEFETDLTTKAVNGSHFDLVAVGNAANTSADVHNLTGAQIESNSQAGHVTGFERPEDGAWDTIDHNKFYFVTTASITGHSKLWGLDFTDAKNPTLGGNIKMLLDGTEGQLMFDNITVSQDGKITLCEDPGNADRVAKVWQYDPANASLTEIAHHDPAHFDPNLNGPGI